jgi:hypothetical protein
MVVHSDCVQEFLHNANKKQEATNDIQRSLSDISKDCLELIFITFCDRSESYKTRRWVIYAPCMEGLLRDMLTASRSGSWFSSLPLTPTTM